MKTLTLEYSTQLASTGLTIEQAYVYETLLKLGQVAASSIVKALPLGTSLSRPLVYKVLEELIAKNLAEKYSPDGKVATFKALHPGAITTLIEEQKRAIDRTREQFTHTAGQLASLYNLTAGKPGIQYFEGKDGLWELLQDSLRAKSEILTYADLEAIATYIPDLNAEYSTLREEKGVKKRGLVIDSPEARKFLTTYDGAVTTTKLIPAGSESAHFATVMQIYDDKISYMTLTREYLIGIIITDRQVAATHRYLFESLWRLTPGEVV